MPMSAHVIVNALSLDPPTQSVSIAFDRFGVG
jgi:hypothetical protein